MGNSGTAGLTSLGSHSTGVGLGALLAFAPATMLSLALPVELQSARAPVTIQMPHAQVSTWTMTPVIAMEQGADEQLRTVAAVAFKDLLQSQSDIEPDIAAIIYGNRSALYSSIF